MKVFVTVSSGILVNFDAEEFVGLSDAKKEAQIGAAVKEIVSEGVQWYEISEKVAI
ncbi:hypothetical protein LIT32_25070 (plasmid) [Bacillus sp. CMF21]|nr:hypothetical protein LIT32_25070 [Bacillus sp. CMF21]